jgi:hypothetical protein
MKKTVILVLLLNSFFLLSAQSDDPAIREAKEKTVVIFDLGRFFGFLYSMEQDAKDLKLSQSQMEEIAEKIDYFLQLDRVEAEDAEEALVYLEDELLTVDQLMYVDELTMARQENRGTKSESGSGAGAASGSGQLAGYAAGGAFNPLKDRSKTIGQDIWAFREYLMKKLQ